MNRQASQLQTKNTPKSSFIPVRSNLLSDHSTEQAEPPLVPPILHEALPTFQAKLTIGQPNDKYEQEADRVADQVMRMPEPRIQRVCPKCEDELDRQPLEDEEEEETLQTKPLAETITPLVQRQAEPMEEEEEEEEKLQTQTTSGQSPTVSSSLQNRIISLRGGGQPLPQSERVFFEPRFGADFSQVKIHTDNRAAETARAVNARAFTLGEDIVFGTSQYKAGTTEGRHLLAHELTHVLQQNGQRSKPTQSEFDSLAMPKPVTQAQYKTQAMENTLTSAPEQIQRVNRLVPTLPMRPGEEEPPAPLTLSSMSVPTTVSGRTRASSSNLDVYYEKDNPNRGEITLHQREARDRILHTVPIPATPNSGHVTIPSGITIPNDTHHYELDMVFIDSRGRRSRGLGRRRPQIRFSLCPPRPPTRTGRICLTFDDGPQDGTREVLDTLRARGASAVFFLTGSNLRSDESANFPLVRRMLSQGHQIGNHTLTHAPRYPRVIPPRVRRTREGRRTLRARRIDYRTAFGDLSTATQRRDFRAFFESNRAYFEDVFRRHSERFPGFRLARLPGGGRLVSIPIRGGGRRYIYVEQTESLGYTHVGWNFEFAPNGTFGHVDERNWKCIQGVAAELERYPRPGEIILFHDRHWAGTNQHMLNTLLARLQSWGFTFGRINQGGNCSS